MTAIPLFFSDRASLNRRQQDALTYAIRNNRYVLPPARRAYRDRFRAFSQPFHFRHIPYEI
jgi:hypothetical protein